MFNNPGNSAAKIGHSAYGKRPYALSKNLYLRSGIGSIAASVM